MAIPVRVSVRSRFSLELFPLEVDGLDHEDSGSWGLANPKCRILAGPREVMTRLVGLLPKEIAL